MPTSLLAIWWGGCGGAQDTPSPAHSPWQMKGGCLELCSSLVCQDSLAGRAGRKVGKPPSAMEESRAGAGPSLPHRAPGGHCSCLGALTASHGSSRLSGLVPHCCPSLPRGHSPCIRLFDGAACGLKAGMSKGSLPGPWSLQREPVRREAGRTASQPRTELGCSREVSEPEALPRYPSCLTSAVTGRQLSRR